MPDDLEKLIAQLGSGEADEEFSGILEGMMGSLMSKEILYEPLKELHDKVCTRFILIFPSLGRYTDVCPLCRSVPAIPIRKQRQT